MSGHGAPSGENGAFTVDRTLHIFTGGSLTTSGGAALSIDITPSGDFLMDNGALISGDFATGTGSAITITLANGDVDLAPGSIIRSNGKSGGAIKITTTATHTIDIDGLVESVGSISGTGEPGTWRRDDHDRCRLRAHGERYRQGQQPR